MYTHPPQRSYVLTIADNGRHLLIVFPRCLASTQVGRQQIPHQESISICSRMTGQGGLIVIRRTVRKVAFLATACAFAALLMAFAAGAATTTYVYDALGRLTSVTRSD